MPKAKNAVSKVPSKAKAKAGAKKNNKKQKCFKCKKTKEEHLKKVV